MKNCFCTKLYKELQHKDGGQDQHARSEFLEVSADHIDEYVADQTQYNTIGNAICQRHEDDADKGRDRLRIVREVDFLYGRHHHQTHQNQHRCGSSTRNGQEERRKEKRYEETQSGDKGSQSAASAFAHTRSTLHKCGDGTGAQHGAGCRTYGIYQECLFQMRNLSVLADHARFGGNTDQGSDSVEHIYKQEGKYHDDHFFCKDMLPLKLHENRFDGRRCAEESVHLGDAHRDTDQRGEQNSDQ